MDAYIALEGVDAGIEVDVDCIRVPLVASKAMLAMLVDLDLREWLTSGAR